MCMGGCGKKTSGKKFVGTPTVHRPATTVRSVATTNGTPKIKFGSRAR